METSEYAPIESGISNMDFLRGLGKALIALALSALILIPTFLTFYPHPAPADVQPKTIPANELAVILGGAKKSATALQLAELSEDGRAILSKRIQFKAEDYPFVNYQITNRHPGTVIYLIWRTADNPEEIKNTRLYWSGDKATSINMAKFEKWSGNITELGLDIYGDLRDKPLVVENLAVAPYSWRFVMSTIWSEWTAFHGWDQTSINYLRGTPENPILSPTVAAAAWAGLALLLSIIPYIFRKSQNVVAYGAAILIPWISLDILWQGELDTQLKETKYLFAGKTQHEKHLAEPDSELYSYAQHLKDEVLPKPGARIFLLHNSRGHNYRRLRTQFHLLPHNIYNYGRHPQSKHTRPGDFILVLGKIPGLAFNPTLSVLKWGKNNTLNVNQIDKTPIGTLYQLPDDRGDSDNG